MSDAKSSRAKETQSSVEWAKKKVLPLGEFYGFNPVMTNNSTSDLLREISMKERM